MAGPDDTVSKLKGALSRIVATADRRFSGRQGDRAEDASGIDISYERGTVPSGRDTTKPAERRSEDLSAAMTVPTVRDRTVLWYAALAGLAIIPGLALGSNIDLDVLRRRMLDVSFGSGNRFWMGVVGTAIIAVLLLYPLRKMLSQYINVGSVGAWFRVHLVLGILGPILILYHANFKFALRDINANVALVTMLVVVASGFIGHLVYTRASLDLYAARAELRQRLNALLAELKSLELPENDIAAVARSIDDFENAIPMSKHGVAQSVRDALQYEAHHQRTYRQVSTMIADARDRYSWPQPEYLRVRQLLGGHLAASASIARRAAMRSLGEQLWSRWRLLHLPLFLVMTIATILHIRSVWDSSVFFKPRSAASVAAPVLAAGTPTPVYTPDEAVAALRRYVETSKASTPIVASGQEFFANATFVGSASCKACHESQFTEWANTWHAKMYRAVNNPSAKDTERIVVGAFDGKAIAFEGVRGVPTEDAKETGTVSFEVMPTIVHPQTGAPGYFFTVRDPSAPADAQTFQVAIVIGGNWEQMYHVKVGDNYFAAPLRWKVGPPGVGAWQVDSTAQPQHWIFFRGGQAKNGKPRSGAQLPFDRFADGQCIGCHTTGYRFERPAGSDTKWIMVGNSVGNGVDNNGVMPTAKPGAPGTAAEMGIGCESCHGPGSAHNAAQSEPGGGIPKSPKPLVPGKTINPLKHLTSLQQSMMCGTCHSRGINDLAPATARRPGDRFANTLGFPDITSKAGDKGFLPGDTDLSARIKMFGGFGHNPQSFWPNDWAKQGRMQWQDHIKSAHHTTGAASCLTCHSGHAPMDKRVDGDKFQLRQAKAVNDGLATPRQENQCESCHKRDGTAMQPNKEMYEGSVMHNAGVTCVNCHMTQVGNRMGRTTRTPAKGAPSQGEFDTSAAGYGKHWDVSSHIARVAPTSEGEGVAAGIGMRSACIACHGAPEHSRQPSGRTLTEQKIEDVASCRKDYVRSRLERLQLGLLAAEQSSGRTLLNARAQLQFIIADRSWGAHNWDKTLRTLQAAQQDIAGACGKAADCQVGKLTVLNTSECSDRTLAVQPPNPIAPIPVTAKTQPAAPQPSAPPPAASAPVATPPVATPANPPAGGTAPPPPPATATTPQVPLDKATAPAPAAAPAVTAPAVTAPAATAPAVTSPAATAPTVAAPTVPPTQPATQPPATAPAAPVAVPAPPVVAAPPPAVTQAPAAVAQPSPPPRDTLSVFKDCPTCPDMVVAPPGSFMMGSPDTDAARTRFEVPQRKVDFARSFAAGRFAVTLAQFEEFAAETSYVPAAGCGASDAKKSWTLNAALNFRAPGFQQIARNPVVCVSYNDATAYTAWLSRKTGKTYRLLTEAEREYITRAGTTTIYWWGDLFDPRAAAHSGTQATGPRPVDAYVQNPWGFFNVHGNVAEWTQDCFTPFLAGLPTNGAAATTGDCTGHPLRGGAWIFPPVDLRSADRVRGTTANRYTHVGFRVARDLDAGR